MYSTDVADSAEPSCTVSSESDRARRRTGGPIAALVMLNCTEQGDYSPFNG
jgi:hypothetical protein